MRIKRILAGLSQAELGRRLERSATWVSLVERGYLIPSDDMMHRLNKQLQVNIDMEFLNGAKNEERT